MEAAVAGGELEGMGTGGRSIRSANFVYINNTSKATTDGHAASHPRKWGNTRGSPCMSQPA